MASDNTAINHLEDEDEDEELKEYEEPFFDMVEFDKTHDNKPVFTREMLQSIQNVKLDALSKSKLKVDSEIVYTPSPNERGYGEEFVVGRIHERPNYGNKKISVRFLSCIEMHPEFQKFKPGSEPIETLREYNLVPGQSDYIPVPFVLNWDDRVAGSSHENAAQMALRRSQLRDLIKIWESSTVKKLFLDCFRSSNALRSSNVRIKRIICFGLGSLTFDGSTDRELQHLAAIDLAQLMDARNRFLDPEAPRVEVWFQDPLYEIKDRVLLRELRPDIHFVDDPLGLLGIDDCTFVMANFLPIEFPLLQIIADMFEEGHGPAGFLIDHLQREDGDPESSMYRLHDRLSPRASRMFGNYKRCQEENTQGFRDPDIQGQNQQLFNQQVPARRLLWLEYMSLYIRLPNETSAT